MRDCFHNHLFDPELNCHFVIQKFLTLIFLAFATVIWFQLIFINDIRSYNQTKHNPKRFELLIKFILLEFHSLVFLSIFHSIFCASGLASWFQIYKKWPQVFKSSFKMLVRRHAITSVFGFEFKVLHFLLTFSCHINYIPIIIWKKIHEIFFIVL